MSKSKNLGSWVEAATQYYPHQVNNKFGHVSTPKPQIFLHTTNLYNKMKLLGKFQQNSMLRLLVISF